MTNSEEKLTEKQELIKEIEKKFEELKKKIGFKASLEDIDDVFSIKDYVIHTGYVREKFSLQLNQTICDYFNSWQNYLIGLIFPAHDYLIRQTESKLFSSEEDKKKIWSLIRDSMKFVSRSSVLMLRNDINLERDFIDESYSFCKAVFIPELLKIVEKIYLNWNSKQ
jgi:hypothetical protein